MEKKKRVVVLGASPKEDRYSNRAVAMLREYGYEVIPVHPTAKEIHGLPVVPRLDQISSPVDTVTIYLNPTTSGELADSIFALQPRRIIFNPGTENPTLGAAATSRGIQVLHACTLVLLRSGQFE